MLQSVLSKSKQLELIFNSIGHLIRLDDILRLPGSQDRLEISDLRTRAKLAAPTNWTKSTAHIVSCVRGNIGLR